MRGFLPWRGTPLIDLLVVAMAVVLVVLCWSVASVKYGRRYGRHKWTQVTLSAVMLILLTVFEIDTRFFSDWKVRASASPYFNAANGGGTVIRALWIHLFFSTTTLVLWLMIVVRALLKFPSPPQPGEHSRFHKRWGMIAAADMLLTVITGWIFYWLAFVA